MMSLLSHVKSACQLTTQVGTFRLQIHEVGDVTIPVLSSPWDPAVAAPLVRVHDACMTSEVFYSSLCDCDSQLRLAMTRVASEGGAILYMPHEGRGIGLANKVRAYDLQQRLGLDTFEANHALGFADDLRTYEAVPPVLASLGIDAITLLTNNRRKRDELRKSGVRVAACAPVFGFTDNRRYMEAKRAYDIVPRRAPESPRG